MELDGTPVRLVGDQVAQHLHDLADRPVAEHVVVLTEVHRLLQDALATLDDV